ncbi:MAG: CDP-archaeol synthase, partial [Candidatus Micrarchaeota archaeon]
MDLVALIIFLLPVYLANSSPVVLGGGKPIDFGMKFSDGRRLLGDGKTIRGFAAGVACGALAGILVADYYHLSFFADYRAQLFGAVALALGTLVGDAVGSFIKRRFGVDSGKPFFLDSAAFLAVALLFVYPFANATL